MDPSRRNLSAAAAVVIVLLFFVTTEIVSIEAWSFCRHLSGNYHGMCFNQLEQCTHTCIAESRDNIDGYCDDAPPRCYCVTSC
ncbi:hypothetical protein ZWY2020_008817 [Hordeum vulgare]|nr:hypothetical protein ZWY2020_008817 [Hordeum vulgare]